MVIPALEPLLTWHCDRPGCPYWIHDEHSIAEEGREEHRAMHDRLARRTDRCSECTCHVDEQNTGCGTCYQRHRSRRRRRRA